MAVLESWWNGSYAGMVRQRVRLREDEGSWSVEVDGPMDHYRMYPDRSEQEARGLVASLTAQGTWLRVDHLNRRTDGDQGRS
jgi:hypothetical protein